MCHCLSGSVPVAGVQALEDRNGVSDGRATAVSGCGSSRKGSRSRQRYFFCDHAASGRAAPVRRQSSASEHKRPACGGTADDAISVVSLLFRKSLRCEVVVVSSRASWASGVAAGQYAIRRGRRHSHWRTEGVHKHMLRSENVRPSSGNIFPVPMGGCG